MKCCECKDKISLYIDGMLTKEENENIKAHLNACEECNQVYKQTYEIVNILKQAEAVKLPPNFHNELINKVKQEKQIGVSEKNNSILRFNYKKLVPVAAVLLIGVVLFNSDKITIYNNSKADNNDRGYNQHTDMGGLNNETNMDSKINESANRGRSIDLNEVDKLANNEIHIKINNEQLFIKEITTYLEQKKWTYSINNVTIQIDNGKYDELLQWLQQLELVGDIEATGSTEPPFTIIYNK